MKASLIDWTDDLVELLFLYVITIGVHQAGRKDVSDKWNQVDEDFFNNEQCVDIKEAHYIPEKRRKLRDKYEEEKSIAQHEVKCGNKNEYDWNISDLSKIKEEIDEEGVQGKSLKNNVFALQLNDLLYLHNIESRLTLPNRARSFFKMPRKRSWRIPRTTAKTKNADGSISENSSTKQMKKLQRESIETTMNEFLGEVKVSSKQAAPINESAVEIEMMNWIAFHGESIGSLLSEGSNVPCYVMADGFKILSDLELSTIVNMFCAKKAKILPLKSTREKWTKWM